MSNQRIAEEVDQLLILNKELDQKLSKSPCFLVFGKDDSQNMQYKEKYLDIL